MTRWREDTYGKGAIRVILPNRNRADLACVVVRDICKAKERADPAVADIEGSALQVTVRGRFEVVVAAARVEVGDHTSVPTQAGDVVARVIKEVQLALAFGGSGSLTRLEERAEERSGRSQTAQCSGEGDEPEEMHFGR